MDSQITSAARAPAHGDLLGALKRVSLREDPPALALRGIAMSQVGEFARARDLLERASRAFGQRESVARARCVVAEAEIALASRDLQFSDSCGVCQGSSAFAVGKVVGGAEVMETISGSWRFCICNWPMLLATRIAHHIADSIQLCTLARIEWKR